MFSIILFLVFSFLHGGCAKIVTCWAAKRQTEYPGWCIVKIGEAVVQCIAVWICNRCDTAVVSSIPVRGGGLLVSLSDSENALFDRVFGPSVYVILLGIGE